MTLSITEKVEYLAAIGIEAWYPRYALQNAVRSEIESQVVKDSPHMHSANVSEDAPSEANDQIHNSSPSADVFNNIQTSQLTEPETIVANPVTMLEEKPIRFALNLYIYNEYLIVSSLSSDYQQKQSQAQKLLLSILHTVINQKLELRHDHLISWPFFASPNANQGIESAKQYVNGVIEHLTEMHNISQVIVLGGVLPKLNSWTSAVGTIFDRPYLVLPSLYKMLSEPGLKRRAWEAIQASELM